ncbi:hypothetical protein WMF26_39015 [Sorangium sp. So ce185]|uniref:hypothetical protein n=1 Tax=Sorangium sp. So ce185 TaxID=3133287 RepID=UPI003F5E3385
MEFPKHFNFSNRTWTGPRSGEFQQREDAFQQLVGDLLQETLGPWVRVMPTKGRDGSIDAFIKDNARLPFDPVELPGPIIVECKDNDDSRPRVRDNVVAGWKKVAQKLTQQAAEGWPGIYQPWSSARSYVYVTSAVLPHQQAHHELQNHIKQFFHQLCIEGRSDIQRVVVVDWNDLRAILAKCHRLADRWLGVGLTSLRSHAEQVATFADFRRYLVDLPFVAPNPESPTHPDQLVQLVIKQAEVSRGVILTGAGGVGKTRTLIEVADRANKSGWRVLHIVPNGSEISVSELAQEIFAGGTDTLVVCDYLERISINVVSLRHQLLPQARSRQMRVAFLASARTAPTERDRDPDRASFFDVVELELAPDQSQHISTAMEKAVAPQATAALGSKKIRELTGDRPIIALFILQELERIILAGTLDMAQLSAIRPGDLTDWLRRRFAEDELRPVRRSLWDSDSDVEPTLLGAAAALALCPASEEILCALVRDVLTRNRSEMVPERRAKEIIRGLLKLRWIRDTGGSLDVAHDVVTECLLDQALHDATDHVREDILSALLQPCSTSLHALTQVTVAFGRLVISGSSFTEELRLHAQRWFTEVAPTIGQTLSKGSTPEASAALWAVVSGPLWGDTAIRSWADVIDPWLEHHGTTSMAWMVLYSLYEREDLPEPHAVRLLGIAHDWIQKHPESEYVSTVLLALLNRTDLAPLPEPLFEIAWSWYERHRSLSFVAFVLWGLLKRPELPPAIRARIGNEALAWCAQCTEPRMTGPVLAKLLEREDISADIADAAIAYAWEWLERYRSTNDASYVISALVSLGKQRLCSWSHLIDMALAWLDRHLQTNEAANVLATLLYFGHEHPDHVPRVSDLAWTWLKQHEHTFDAVFVLSAALEMPKQKPDQEYRIICSSLRWLQVHGRAPSAQGLVLQLLSLCSTEHELADKVQEAAIAWLRANGDLNQSAMFIVKVVECDIVPKDVSVRAAVEWLMNNASSLDAPRVIVSLLSRRDAMVDHLLSHLLMVLMLALIWVGANGPTVGSEDLVAFLFGGRSLQDLSVRPDLVVVKALLSCVRASLNNGAFDGACLAIPTMLAVAMRTDSTRVQREACALARRVLRDSRMRDELLEDMRAGCQRLLDAGAWPDREHALPLLNQLRLLN